MDHINTLLTNSDANTFFGVESHSFPLGSATLEAALRYVAILHCPDDIEKVELIKVEHTTFHVGARGNDFAESFSVSNSDILIAESRNGADLPYIDKDGWIVLDEPPYPVAAFLTKASATNVFLNNETKKAILFVKKATDKWIDELCSSLFRVLPRIYPDGYRPSGNELELFKAAHNHNSEKFVEIINELATKYDFREMSYRRILLGWSKGLRQQQLAALSTQSQSTRAKIESQENVLADLYNSLGAILQNIDALERATRNDDDDSLYRFFNTHKQLRVYQTSSLSNGGKALYYSVCETIEYFDEDAFKRVYDNPGSSMSRNATSEVKEIFYAIFAQNKGKFRVESMFRLDNLSSLRAVRGQRTGVYGATHLPHPHLYHHACLGGNGNEINRYIADGDWDLAIEQTISATKNINFGDATVIGEFTSDVRNNMDCKCIIADNGTEMTPREFLNYIRTAENNEGDNNG